MARMASPASEVSLDLLETVDSPESPACPDQRDTEVSMAWLELKALKVGTESVERQDHLVL